MPPLPACDRGHGAQLGFKEEAAASAKGEKNLNYRLPILFCFIAIVAIQFLIDWLNISHMKAMGNKVPDGFEHVVDADKIDKSVRYTLAKEKVSFISGIFMTPVSLLFIFAGGLPLYDGWTTGLTSSFILQSLIFLIAISYAASILELPFDLYRTFVVEKNFGFNKTTLKLWLVDGIKNMAIGLVVSIILYGGIFSIVKALPGTWWIWGWGLFASIVVLMMFIFPTFIAPLFNKFESIDDSELAARIKETAKKAGVPLSQVVKMDASKRSGHSNAYFTGIGKAKKVVLYDTLIAQLSTDELVVVLAHEFGHLKKKHILKSLVTMILLALAGFYLVFLGINSNMVAHLFGYEGLSFAAQALILTILSGPVMFLFKPIFNWISRQKEKEADRFAVELTGAGEHLASALIKLSAENLSNLYPHPFYAFMTYSHPPVVDRVAQIRKI